MIKIILKNLWRRPIRTGLTLVGLSLSAALMTCLLSFGQAYESAIRTDLDRMGMQMMLVPLGCPYDGAARALKGRTLDSSLPESALIIAQKDPAVSLAAPVYTAAIPRKGEKRTDMWVGLDDATIKMHSWWKFTPGSHGFDGPNSVILGSEAAATELRKPGDRLYSPETNRDFMVAGVLERSGTSDDSLFFIPLKTAQQMFGEPGRLTAISIRLKDPSPPEIAATAARLQKIPGAQVTTLTEMLGVFLNLIASAKTLVMAITVVALVVSLFSVFNTIMANVIERTRELAVMRAIGMSKLGLFNAMLMESVVVSVSGALCGILLAATGGGWMERAVHPYLPLAPSEGLQSVTLNAALSATTMIMLAGICAGLYPAWVASRLHPSAALRLDI